MISLICCLLLTKKAFSEPQLSFLQVANGGNPTNVVDARGEGDSATVGETEEGADAAAAAAVDASVRAGTRTDTASAAGTASTAVTGAAASPVTPGEGQTPGEAQYLNDVKEQGCDSLS